MNRFTLMRALALAFLSFQVSSTAWAEATKTLTPHSQATLQKIEKLVGAKCEYIPSEDIYKVTYPRSDLHLEISGVKMVPALGLSCWASFKIAESVVLVEGDTAMTEDQVNPVLSVALENGLEVTAIHNHFFWDSPKLIFMHLSGLKTEGPESLETLSAAVGKVFSKIKETSLAPVTKTYAHIDPAKSSLNLKKIEDILGKKGQLSDGVYKITIGQNTTLHHLELGNAMGSNTWMAFAGSDEQAVVDGDFVMLEEQVQPVLKALRAADIYVVALHNHMLMESPRMMFLHFWGRGSTSKLAQGLKAALEAQEATRLKPELNKSFH